MKEAHEDAAPAIRPKKEQGKIPVKIGDKLIDAVPIIDTKMQMVDNLAYPPKGNFNKVLGVFYTTSKMPAPQEEVRRYFVVKKRHDSVIFPLKTSGKDGEIPVMEIEREGGKGNSGAPFSRIAQNMDKITGVLAAKKWAELPKEAKVGRTLDEIKQEIRGEIGQDIINIAHGEAIERNYSSEDFAKMAEFAAIIRCDKGRGAPKGEEERLFKATPYINHVLKSSHLTFEQRFGGDNPPYIGSGKKEKKTSQSIMKKPEYHLVPEALAKKLEGASPPSNSINSGPERLKWIGRATEALDKDIGKAFPALAARSALKRFDSDISLVPQKPQPPLTMIKERPAQQRVLVLLWAE